MNMLAEWIATERQKLESSGFSVSLNETEMGSCISANLDSDRVVGTICHWEPNRFEFQFNDCDTEEVAFLETVEFDNIPGLSAFFFSLLKRLER